MLLPVFVVGIRHILDPLYKRPAPFQEPCSALPCSASPARPPASSSGGQKAAPSSWQIWHKPRLPPNARKGSNRRFYMEAAAKVSNLRFLPPFSIFYVMGSAHEKPAGVLGQERLGIEEIWLLTACLAFNKVTPCLVSPETNSPSPAQRLVRAGAQKANSYQFYSRRL